MYTPLQKPNTDKVDKSASRLWTIFRREKGLPAEPTMQEIEGDGAESGILGLALFVLSRPIPIFFDEDLKPTTDSNRCATASTLAGYVGKYLKYFQQIYPDHPEWKDLNGGRG